MTEERRNRRRKSGLIYKLIILILLIVIAFSLYKIGTILYGYWQGRQVYKQVSAEAGKNDGDEKNINWAKLRKKYPDVKAWLYSKGTVIDYPVAQGKDNEWYLHHLITGEWNGAGTLFIDAGNKDPFHEFLTVIYGHHMRDGSMFGSLVKYRDPEYYEKHRVLRIYTPEQNYDLIVIGSCTIPGNSERYQLGFDGEDEKQEYLDWISQNTETVCTDQADTDDRIVMLSTCTYEFDDARFVLFGKLQERR